MTPEECFTLFEESRDGMISKYKIATEEALIHADFLNNRELNIVQTLALYIVGRLVPNSDYSSLS